MAETENPESELNCIFAINCGYAGLYKGLNGLSGDDLMEKWTSAESKTTQNSNGDIIHKEGLDFFKAIEGNLEDNDFEKIVVFSLGNKLIYGGIKTTMFSHIPVF